MSSYDERVEGLTLESRARLAEAEAWVNEHAVKRPPELDEQPVRFPPLDPVLDGNPVTPFESEHHRMQRERAADLRMPLFIEPAIPPELCGAVGCVLTPHSSKVRHSWAEQRSTLRDTLTTCGAFNARSALPQACTLGPHNDATLHSWQRSLNWPDG